MCQVNWTQSRTGPQKIWCRNHGVNLGVSSVIHGVNHGVKHGVCQGINDDERSEYMTIKGLLDYCLYDTDIPTKYCNGDLKYL